MCGLKARPLLYLKERSILPPETKKAVPIIGTAFIIEQDISDREEIYWFLATTSPLIIREVLPSVAFEVTTIAFVKAPPAAAL